MATPSIRPATPPPLSAGQVGARVGRPAAWLLWAAEVGLLPIGDWLGDQPLFHWRDVLRATADLPRPPRQRDDPILDTSREA